MKQQATKREEKKVKKDLSYYAPPGMELEQEKKIFVIGMILSALFSVLIFGIEFSDCLEKIY